VKHANAHRQKLSGRLQRQQARSPILPDFEPGRQNQAADALAEAIETLEDLRTEEDGGQCGANDAPGHRHTVPGIWDDDNGELAGKPCAWCAAWDQARAALAAYRTGKERGE